MCRFLLAVTLLVTASPVLGQGPQVASTAPVSEEVGVPRGGAITVSFSEALNPATASSALFRVQGRWTGPVTVYDARSREVAVLLEGSVAVGTRTVFCGTRVACQAAPTS